MHVVLGRTCHLCAPLRAAQLSDLSAHLHLCRSARLGNWPLAYLGAAVKSGSLVPDTALVRTVLTDKTGTLTTGDKVRQLH